MEEFLKGLLALVGSARTLLWSRHLHLLSSSTGMRCGLIFVGRALVSFVFALLLAGFGWRPLQ